MKLKQLIKDIDNLTVKGSKDIDITNLSENSKSIGPNGLFIARKGCKADGNSYAQEAVRNGAVALLSDIFNPSLEHIVQLLHDDVIETEAKLAQAFYADPSQELLMVGVTGTSGKTTVSYAIKHIFEKNNVRSGLIGTIEYVIDATKHEASRTTPDVISNHKMLREMVKAGCSSCVMEVTSHALDQKRVQEVEYDIAVFLNLTPEHLDYHKDMEEYFQAKQKLFLSLAKKRKNHPKVAIVNKDDLWSDRLIKSIPCQSMTFAIDASADVKATDIAFTNGGTSFHVHYKGQKVPFFWPLVGRFNVYNALAVISVGLSCGMSLEHLASILKTFESAPGRLDRVDNVLDLNIFVDYAHKEDALKNVLVTLRECCHGKLITVFGCGGDRDKQKRPSMGKVAEAFSDMVIVTTDNPRSEDPYAIVREIQSGFHNKDQHLVELDRKKAIEKAISLANKKDIILIAGKGHEKKQVFQHVTLDFDDKAIAEEYCRALKGET